MTEKKKEVVISTENLNCYGARVITGGINISQYRRNPVLLYMHRRYGREDMPVGRVENLRFEDDKLIGTPVFDLNDPDAKRIADKWENDFLRMVSPSLEIIETSSEQEMLLTGQTRPTVTKSKLIEVSIVDIGGNDDALVLQFEKGGKVLELSSGSDCEALPLLNLETGSKEGTKPTNLNTKKMEQILLTLGLDKDATSAQAVAEITALKLKAAKVDTIELTAITGAVDAAEKAKKITADQKNHFISLGKSAGLEALQKTLELMKPAVKPTDVIDMGKAANGGKVELKWNDLTPDSAEKLKQDDPKQYAQLFKAEFGIEPF